MRVEAPEAAGQDKDDDARNGQAEDDSRMRVLQL